MKQFALMAVVAAAMTAGGATAGPIFNPDNGHYYEFISGKFTWQEANDAASAQTFLGAVGYLATITTQAEQDFVVGSVSNGFSEGWLGGFQPPGSPEPAGGWSWVTGEAFVYTAWGGSEPNNIFGNNPNEDRIVMQPLFSTWYDLPGSFLTPDGYFVEFSPAAVPEPASVALLAVGAAGLFGRRLRRRAA